MGKKQWNIIKKKQNGLKQSKMKNHPPYRPTPTEESHQVTSRDWYCGGSLGSPKCGGCAAIIIYLSLLGH